MCQDRWGFNRRNGTGNERRIATVADLAILLELQGVNRGHVLLIDDLFLGQSTPNLSRRFANEEGVVEFRLHGLRGQRGRAGKQGAK